MSIADATYDHPFRQRNKPAPRWRTPRSRGTRGLVTIASAAALLVGASVAVRVTSTAAGPPRPGGIVLQEAGYAPHELVVGYSGSASSLIGELDRLANVRVTISPRPETTPQEELLQLPQNLTPPQAARVIEGLPGVRYALPDYIAHIAGSFIPNDTGNTGRIHGWEALQWNFLPSAGINAPEAWANLLADHRPGARGVTVAVVDTGIAFRTWRTFKRSPDFSATRFVDPCDLVAGSIKNGTCSDPFALDREGHGTFVSGTIAEATNNRIGLTGLAYGAALMPVRVLDAQGNGDSSTIAAGIRYAVQHGARVINLSIEFSPGTTSGQIPDVVSAIAYAHNHNVVVVGAAGNDEDNTIDYPAALTDVISVGATTRDRCLAIYSDVGHGLDLVAPGGGDDAAAVPGSKCHPLRNLPDIYQMTFGDPTHPGMFGLPSGWFGTSMATPAVSAAAAMVIASGVIGQHPTPIQVLDRLEATAQPLGSGLPNNDYGYGLLDVGFATHKGGPLVPPNKPYSLKGAGAGGAVVRSLHGRSPAEAQRAR
jgi:serine protease